MQTISEYKKRAGTSLVGNWGKSAIASLIYYLIFGILTSIPSCTFRSSYDTLSAGDNVSIVFTILLLPLAWGFTVFFLNIYRGNNPTYGSLFDGFRSGKDYGRYLSTLLLQSVYEILWTLLLFVPGIIKGYSYSMTSFILKDNPNLKNNAAIEESMRMMEGHKLQLFLLDLSMIGWFFASCLTLGIGFLFLIPYNQTAHAAFYEDLKAEDNE